MLEISDLGRRGIKYYPCSENKGADQLRGYREADLRLCFRIYAKSRFSYDAAQIRNTSRRVYFVKKIPIREQPIHETFIVDQILRYFLHNYHKFSIKSCVVVIY